jgi:hypothetical protein
MSGRIACFLAGVLVGAAAVFTTIKYHVVRAEDGFHLVPKLTANFSEAFVDVRNFGIADWDDHRSLAAALVQAEKGYLLKDAASESLRRSVSSVLDIFGTRR